MRRADPLRLKQLANPWAEPHLALRSGESLIDRVCVVVVAERFSASFPRIHVRIFDVPRPAK